MSPPAQTSLGDEEARELLAAVLDSKKYHGRLIGAKFRDSIRAYESGEICHEKYSVWAPPIDRFRLPVDDVLLELMSRKHSPRIDQHHPENFDDLKLYGPFCLTRLHLDFAAFCAIDSQYDKTRVAEKIKFLKEIDQAARILAGISWQSLRKLHLTFKVIRPSDAPHNESDWIADWLKHFDQAHCSLQRLRHHTTDNLSLTLQDGPSLGRPKLIWREQFVGAVADLWRLLTFEDASRSEDSLFGKFLYAAWNSLDDEMPEVSFARAIRDRT